MKPGQRHSGWILPEKAKNAGLKEYGDNSGQRRVDYNIAGSCLVSITNSYTSIMNAPKQATWTIAIFIAAVAMIQEFNLFDLNLGAYTFYMMIASVALLAIASKLKGI